MTESAGLSDPISPNDDDLVRAFAAALHDQLDDLTHAVADAWTAVAPAGARLEPCCENVEAREKIAIAPEVAMRELLDSLERAANDLAAAHEALTRARSIAEQVSHPR